MRRSHIAAIVVTLAAACAACRFDSSPGGTDFLCMEKPICPGDLVCVDGRCVEEGAGADARVPGDGGGDDAAEPADAACDGGTLSPEADLCTDGSPDITAEARCPGGVTIEGDTTEYQNDLGTPATTCLSQATGGVDAVYRLQVAGGDQIVAAIDAAWDTAIYLSTGCMTGATCPAGADVSLESGEELIHTVEETEAGTLWLLVDTTGPGTGPFTLEVTIQ